ncbi:MAG: ABC transporter ATP-binding protein, partial [Erysipelotrichaceae bacterium]|nr:ABC transporter ATP-binding protein [Erysipelotrichaceae bacterium]
KAFRKLTEGKTVVMIAHRLSTVVSADRIIVLDSGMVVEEGTHAQLLEKGGKYAGMWADYREAVNWRIHSGKEVQ